MTKGKSKAFGAFFKKIRKGKGYSIKQLSPRLDVNYSYLSKIENGHSTPSEDFIDRISIFFEIDKEELMVRAGKVPDDILSILQNNPNSAISFLRKEFGEY